MSKKLNKENKEEILKCSICGNIIKPNDFGWAFGNNAYPINNGNCCDRCNYLYVIPASLKQLQH